MTEQSKLNSILEKLIMGRKKEVVKEDKGAHYRYEYDNVKLDPARIIVLYDAHHPMQQAIVKKSLCAGQRGKKDLIEDIDDIICAAERWKEMIEEDS